MNRDKMLQLLELIGYIGMILVLVSYFILLIYSAVTYDQSMSIPFSGIVIVTGVFALVPFSLLLGLYIIVRCIERRKGLELRIQSNQFTLDKQRVIRIGKILGIILLISAVGAVVFQKHFLYFPTRNESAEARLSLEDDIDKHTISDSNIQVVGWGKLELNKGKKTILFFGGNAMDAATTISFYNSRDWFDMDNYNFIMFDYPTYGESTGRLTEHQIKQHAVLIFSYLLEEGIEREDIIVMGFSLGTGVASYLSSVEEFDKLVLIAPYSSMTDVINSRLPVFYGPLEGLVRHQYNTDELVEDMNEKVLVIASLDDDVIPYRISNRLIEELNPEETVIMDGLRHNDLVGSTKVNEEIKEFLDN